MARKESQADQTQVVEKGIDIDTEMPNGESVLAAQASPKVSRRTSASSC